MDSIQWIEPNRFLEQTNLPHHAKCALDYMRDNLTEKITLSDVVRKPGVPYEADPCGRSGRPSVGLLEVARGERMTQMSRNRRSEFDRRATGLNGEPCVSVRPHCQNLELRISSVGSSADNFIL
jgi:hypothetical protein